MPVQALILLAILAASAIIFTLVFVIVADRELAKPENAESVREEGTGRSEADGGEREEDGVRTGRERSESSEADGAGREEYSERAGGDGPRAKEEGGAVDERTTEEGRTEREQGGGGEPPGEGGIGRKERGGEPGGGRGA